MFDLDVILNFFTDTLSGYVYIITTVISIIIILGIIGFLSERKFNLENNGILTRNYNTEQEETILGDPTLQVNQVQMNHTVVPPMQTVSISKQQEMPHHDEVI